MSNNYNINDSRVKNCNHSLMNIITVQCTLVCLLPVSISVIYLISLYFSVAFVIIKFIKKKKIPLKHCFFFLISQKNLFGHPKGHSELCPSKVLRDGNLESGQPSTLASAHWRKRKKMKEVRQFRFRRKCHHQVWRNSILHHMPM